MEAEQPEPNIVIFDDEEECAEEEAPNPQIFVFDDEEMEDSYESIEPSQTKEQAQSMTEQQYNSKCNELQNRIIFNNISNQSLAAPPKTQNFFQQAKERRKSNEIIYNKRRSRNVEDIQFDPKSGDIKVNYEKVCFKKAKLVNENIKDLERSLQDEIDHEFIEESPAGMSSLATNQGQSFKGALVSKKEELRIEPDREKSVLKVSNLRQFLYTELPNRYSVSLCIKVSSNLFSTKFKVYFQENNKFILACQKSKGFSKCIFSFSQVHISEDHISYLGKLERNSIFEQQYQVYDAGYDNNRTKMMQFYKKQLASISFSEDEGSVRNMEVLIATSGNQSTDFTIIDEDNDLIRTKYKNKSRRNIQRFVTKEPTYDPKTKSYGYNVKGFQGIESKKNFIIENSQHPDAVIFSKQDKESYILKVKSPFSILQAVSIAISSIHVS